MKSVENKFGTGAIKQKIDLRDRKWKKLASASTPFDWEKGFDIEQELKIFLKDPSFKIPIKNQNGSSSCCGQAAAYYEEVQDCFEKGIFTEKSARDAYSQIFYPQSGGSTTRDTLNLLTKKGVCKELNLTSYQSGNPPTEAFMRSRKDATQGTVADAETAKGTGYAMVNSNIEDFAQAIRDNRGMIFTVDGKNNGTWFSTFPKYEKISEWSHELYAGKVKMINGKKYLGVLNSWGSEVGESGWQWIGEEFFKNGHLHSGGVLYDITNELLKTEVSLLQKVLNLLQTLFNNMTGYETKKIIS